MELRLDGYEYEFLPAIGDTKKITFWRPLNYGLFRCLKSGQFDILWIHGYARWIHWVAIIFAKILGIKVFIRDESTNSSAERGRIKQFIKKIFFKILNAMTDGFLAIGSMNRQYYVDFGIENGTMKDIRGGDVDENVKIALNILQGEKGPKREIVIINAGAAIYIAGKADSFLDGIELAKESIDSGKAVNKLRLLKEMSQ